MNESLAYNYTEYDDIPFPGEPTIQYNTMNDFEEQLLLDVPDDVLIQKGIQFTPSDPDRSAIVKEVIRTKMLGGEIIRIRRGRILGWCHHYMHPGAVSKSIMQAHDCLGKKCPYLERNELSPFWKELEAKKRKKRERKEKIRTEREEQERKRAAMAELAERWQSYVDDIEADLQIVRIENEMEDTFRIYYVSDNSFADGNLYPDFKHILKRFYPQHKFTLLHIRDASGHFVTRKELSRLAYHI